MATQLFNISGVLSDIHTLEPDTYRCVTSGTAERGACPHKFSQMFTQS